MFCYNNEVTLGRHLRMGTVCQGNQPGGPRIGIFSPILPTLGEGGGQRPMPSDLINCTYVTKSPYQPRRMGFEELLGW